MKVYRKGLGVMRVLHYQGDGFFVCLTNKDEKYILHRRNLEWRK